MEKNLPVKQFRDETNKLVSASVFKNEFGHSVALQISYKKKGDEEFKSKTISILEKELPAVVRVLQQAIEAEQSASALHDYDNHHDVNCELCAKHFEENNNG